MILTGRLSADPALTEENFQVNESAAALELKTPWGKKHISGDFSPSAVSSYRFEIPLADLKPEERAALMGEDKKSVQEVHVTSGIDANTLDRLGKMREPTAEKKAEPPVATPTPGPTRVIIEYDDTDKLVLQANRLFNKGKYFEATLVVDELVRKRPEFVRGWVMKGSLLKVQGYNDLALKAWERALVLEPGNKEIRGLAGKPSK